MSGHVSVLLKESIEALDIKENGIYVDLTLGRAGHSKVILSKLKEGWLYGFDLDATAIAESDAVLREISPRYTLIHASFASLATELASRGVKAVDGILADLGVSSPQFDDPERGFSYRYDARLDMRMDQDSPLSAYEVVNTYGESELLRILRDYGEEPDAGAIARNIIKKRSLAPIETTGELVDVIKASKSMKTLSKKGHPAKQTFQALRIEVNGEAKALETLLQDAPNLLKVGGRLAIITFMSLDDRATKRRFQELSVLEGSRHGLALRPEEIPTPEFALVSKKPILPSEEELLVNPRSASAKLRVLKRIASHEGRKE